MFLFAVYVYIKCIYYNIYLLQVDVIPLLSHAHYEHFYNNIVQIQVGLVLGIIFILFY